MSVSHSSTWIASPTSSKRHDQLHREGALHEEDAPRRFSTVAARSGSPCPLLLVGAAELGATVGVGLGARPRGVGAGDIVPKLASIAGIW
jgi:hypothetical protein